MKFENIQVFNFQGAIRGMRNPKNSWHLSDSSFGITESEYYIDYVSDQVNELYPDIAADMSQEALDKYDELHNYWYKNGILRQDNDYIDFALIGPKDLKLAQTLIAAGPEHRKFLRQIEVCVDITAPLYWWKEFDTYKVGTVANSTSTMHKLASTSITLDCFEIDDYEEITFGIGEVQSPDMIIDYCEKLRQKYLETKDNRYWKELIRWLPESWLQTRTVTMNYENLLGMCSKGQRRFHKLTEWRDSFIEWARSLPYAQELIFIDELEDKTEQLHFFKKFVIIIIEN